MRQIKIVQSITNRDSKTLEKYFSDIAKEELLNAEQEADLARKILEGDQMAMEKLVKANLRFVVSVAKQYQHSKVSLNDLINEGNIGLVKAAQRFDHTRGFKFISYAVWWIRQSIIQALIEKSRLIRLPANKVEVLSKIDKATTVLYHQYDREPTSEELADLLDMDPKKLQNSLGTLTKVISVDKPFEEGNASTMADVIENKDANQIEEEFIHKESLRFDVSRLLSVLSDKEKMVITKFFGLDGEPGISLESIGDRLVISKERVRQIKDKALKKLARNPTARLLLNTIN